MKEIRERYYNFIRNRKNKKKLSKLKSSTSNGAQWIEKKNNKESSDLSCADSSDG